MNSMRYISNERGSQVIEFLGVLPLFMLMIIIVWQFTIAAQAKITAKAAAMEGARMAIVGGDYETAAKRLTSSYSGVQVSESETYSDGYTFVTIKVTFNLPLIDNDTFFDTDGLLVPVTSSVSLRKES